MQNSSSTNTLPQDFRTGTELSEFLYKPPGHSLLGDFAHVRIRNSEILRLQRRGKRGALGRELAKLFLQ